MPAWPADPDHLGTIFGSIANAVEHHDRDDGHVWVRRADAGEFWQIEVADDGPGIAKERQEAVFRVFTTLKPKFGTVHTGIGLALVRKLVLSYGGHVEIEGNRPRGTVVRIHWPKFRYTAA